MAEVLLYNIAPEKLRKIRVALMRLGVAGRTVSPNEYGHPLGYLAGMEGFAPAAEAPGEDIGSEMMVMCSLSSRQFSGLLDALRASRATVTLKAVLNDNNASWSSRELYRALKTEHDTMQEYLAAKKKNRS